MSSGQARHVERVFCFKKSLRKESVMRVRMQSANASVNQSVNEEDECVVETRHSMPDQPLKETARQPRRSAENGVLSTDTMLATTHA